MKSVELLEAVGEKVSPVIYTNIGTLKIEIGQLDQAKEFLQKALHAIEEGGAKEKAWKMTIYFNMGYMYE